MRDAAQYVVLSILLAMSWSLSGCGGGASPTPAPAPAPAPKGCGNRCVIEFPPWPASSTASFGIKTHKMVYAGGMASFIMTKHPPTVAPGGMRFQTLQALDNAKAIIEAGGSSMEQVTSCSVWLSNMTRDIADLNYAWEDVFQQQHEMAPPSRTVVQMAKLVDGDALLDIQCSAAAPTIARSAVPLTGVSPRLLSGATMSSNIVYAGGMQGRSVTGGIAGETTQALKNLEATLAKAGSDPGHVVACTVYISDMKKFGEMNSAYEAFWPMKDGALGGYPSRSCSQAAELRDGANVDITCIAVSNKTGVAAPKIISPWTPLSGVSIATSAEGLVFVSGLQGWDTTNPWWKIVPGGIGPETTQTLKNIDEVFKAAGGDFITGATSCEISLTDLADFDAMNTAYSAFWAGHAAPGRSAFVVAALPGVAGAPGGKVEIKCTGVLSADTAGEGKVEIII